MNITGMCKFCQQYRTVHGIREGFTQEEIDKIATEECDCEGAKEARNIDYQVARGKAAIDRIAGKNETIAQILTAGLRPIVTGAIQSVTIKADSDIRYQMVMKKNIIVKSSKTLTEESDGEAIE